MVSTGPIAASPTRDRGAVRDRLAFDLRRTDADVRFDPGSRHLYATDASNYRHVPTGVVLPRSVEGLVEVVEVCARHGAPMTMRGGGTSLAGQATGPGVVVDVSRHLTKIEDVDPVARTARVQPGVVLSNLQAAAAPFGLRFGPDPSTSNRCTVGGMIGNNSCGPHSLTTGRTVDNVVSLDVLLPDGTRVEVGAVPVEDARNLARGDDRLARIHRDLLSLRDEVGAQVAERFPAIPRRVSGFNLDELLHDDRLEVGRSLVGTEGTCAVVLGATVRLLPRPAHRTLVVLGYPDVVAAAAAVPDLLRLAPDALEGIDEHVVAGAPGHAGARLLPQGGAWLLVEVGADDAAAARRDAATIASTGVPAAVLADDREQRAVWALRSAGLGAVTYVPGRRQKLPGWEDAAVPPDRTAAYLADLQRLLDRHGLEAALYGHFGDGCVHTKIDFDHTTDAGIREFRRFVEDAADVALSHGGSVSGEHGDGQARAELYDQMFGPELVAAFHRFKRIWDPDGLLNPGRVVDPDPLDADLRLAEAERAWTPTTALAFPGSGDTFTGAASRCVGVGTCRRDDGLATMCPSYRATSDEQHSTRGRARLLFELTQPDSDLDGWADDSVRQALDLCLSCKACKAECPVSVDMAALKSEFLHHHHAIIGRPTSDYALGLFRWWARLASLAPGLTNLALGSALGRLARRAVGVTDQRAVPRFATERFVRWFRHRGSTVNGPEVLLLPDTFTDHLEPRIGRAAVEVLEAAGYRVVLPDGPVCCGRPLFDPGLLGLARRTQRTTVDRLVPFVERGVPIVGLEPSCTAALRDETGMLFPDDPAAARVAEAVRTLPELLMSSGWQPPSISADVLVHGHCHHKAVMGMDADGALLDAAGARWRELDAGCCGLAGSFGFEAGTRYDLSVTIGESRLLPAVRAASPDTALVVDGFSCRTQIAHLDGGRRPLHTAQLLAGALDGRAPTDAPPPDETRLGRNDRIALGLAGLAGLAGLGRRWWSRRR